MADTTIAPSLDIQKYKAEADQLNTGLMTLVTVAQGLLERGIVTDDDYAAALDLGNQAASQEKRHLDKFGPLCDYLHKAWKAATGLREEYSSPWKRMKEALRAAAGKWYLDMQRAKQEQERELQRIAQTQQRGLADEAQDLIDQGFVREGRAKLMQAQVTTAPILPDAVPEVANARVTPKYKATVTDVLAFARYVCDGHFDLDWDIRVRGIEGYVKRPVLIVDQVVLNAICDRMGKSLKVPGITVEPDVTIGAKRLK